MGWGTFLIAYVTLAVTIFCPGYLALRGLRLSRQEALCMAPPVTLVAMLVMGLAYSLVGIRAGYALIVLPPLAAFLALFLLRRPWQHPSEADRMRSWLPLLAYVAVGVTMTFLFFCGNLEGNLAAFQPDNDNSFHLSLIKSIAQSGNYSMLHASVYAASKVAPFSGGGSFYPAVFHCVAATVVNLFGLSVSLAENALAAVTVSLVWPLACFWWMSHLFPKDRTAVFGGAVACMVLIAFPWRFFAWGPLFPNMLSLAMVPGAAGTFMELAGCLSRKSGRRTQLLLFLVSLVAIAAAHPNGVFTLGVLLAPYMVSLICNFPARARKSRPHLRLLEAILFLVVVAAVWVVAYKLPALQSVVGYIWTPYTDFGSGLFRSFTLQMAGNRAQSFVAILLIVGIVASLRDWRQHAWLFALFAFTAVQFAVSASLTGTVRQLLCGFWYTDPNRIAANVALAGIPLIALGASQVLTLLQRAFRSSEPLSEPAVLGLTLTVLGVLVGTSVMGHISELEPGFQLSTTASYDFSNMLEYKYSSKSPKGYSAEEQAFVDKVLKTVPKGTLLLNLPNDGSCFAYALQDANVYYKDVTSPDIYNVGQTDAAKLIRRNLNNLSSYKSVQDAVRSIDAHYLLVLDQGTGTEDPKHMLPTYLSREWRGIVSIDDSTPGFKVVLSEGDMRLYELEY